MIVYRIRSRKTGLFSNGGTDPRFTTKGKVWKMKGHLTSHLTQLHAYGRKIYHEHNVEIVPYELIETEQPTISYDEWMGALLERRDATKRRKAEKQAEMDREIRRRDYERLKKEFG